MYDAVSQTIEIAPGNLGMTLRKLIIDSVGKFAHLAQIEYTGFHQFGIAAKPVVSQTDAIIQDLLGISNQLFTVAVPLP